MSQTFSRMQRIADQIQSQLATLLQTKAHDPRFHTVSITAVNVSPDMKNANVYVSCLQESEISQILKALNKASGFFRFELAQTLNLRITPHIRFMFDDSIARGSHISQLIEDANKKEP